MRTQGFFVAVLALALTFAGPVLVQAVDTVVKIKSGDRVIVEVDSGTPLPPDPPVVPSTPDAKTPVGVNIEWPWESNRSMYFTNLWKTARYTSGSVAADGWPTGDFNARVISVEDTSNAGSGAHFPSDTGTYTFKADGSGTVQVAGATITSQSLVNGVLTATITRTNNTQNMDVGVRGATGPVRNIRLWRPGYTDGAGVFTNEFIGLVRQAGGVVRAMDFLETNVDASLLGARAAVVGSNGVLDWSERPKVTDATYTNVFGAPVELVFTLAQVAGVDPYITVSNYTGPDYWQGLAAYAKANLPVGRKIYLEFSNETWQSGNPGFYQGTQVVQAAAAYTGTPSLQDPRYGPANQWYAGQRYTLARTYQMSDVFRAAFGDAAMGSTVRAVFATQSSQPALAADTLSWAWHVYPKPPSWYLWGLMSAPYYGTPASTAGTTQQILDGLWAGATDFVQWKYVDQWEKYKNKQACFYSVAQAYGLAWGCYEVGMDLGYDDVNRKNRIAVSYDPQMRGATLAHTALDLAQGCQLYTYFRLCDAYGRFTWGATDDARATNLPRYAALVEAKGIDPRRWECSVPDPATGYYGISPLTAVLGNGTGLRATYTWGTGGPSKTLVRVDRLLNIYYCTYDTGNPVPRTDLIYNEHKPWSCVWEGTFLPEYTGPHKFEFDKLGTLTAASLAGQNILTTPTVALVAGTGVPVRIAYSSRESDALLRWWVTVDGRKRLVKTSQMVPAL